MATIELANCSAMLTLRRGCGVRDRMRDRFRRDPPREFRAGRAVSRAVADIKEAFEGAEADFAARRAFERQMRLFDEIEEIVVPDIHFDDTPATGKGLGDGWNRGHVNWSQR